MGMRRCCGCECENTSAALFALAASLCVSFILLMLAGALGGSWIPCINLVRVAARSASARSALSSPRLSAPRPRAPRPRGAAAHGTRFPAPSRHLQGAVVFLPVVAILQDSMGRSSGGYDDRKMVWKNFGACFGGVVLASMLGLPLILLHAGVIRGPAFGYWLASTVITCLGAFAYMGLKGDPDN